LGAFSNTLPARELKMQRAAGHVLVCNI
jgi:hypothetical protein